jgi:hypothetical protein
VAAVLEGLGFIIEPHPTLAPKEHQT